MKSLHFIIEESNYAHAGISSIHRTKLEAYGELLRLTGLYQSEGAEVDVSMDGIVEVKTKDGFKQVYRYQHLASELF